MRRILRLVVVAASCAVAGGIAWRWWTAPPLADAGALADAATVAPADADGVLVIAEPARAARWLARRPQALALVLLAAPGADDGMARLRGALAALAREAGGPLTVWWRGRDVAVGGRVSAGAAKDLARLAALTGLPARATPAGSGEVVVAIATAPAILEGARGPRPSLAAGRFAAAARRAGRWWLASAGRDRLEVTSGAAPELPAADDGAEVVTADVAALVGPAASAFAGAHVPARLLLDRGAWALELPGTPASETLARLLSVGGDDPAPAPAGARRWRGVLGEVWARTGGGLALASTPDMLARLSAPPPPGELGRLRGPEVAALCVRAAGALGPLPWMAERAAALRRAAPLVAPLRLARWRLVPDGGRIVLEW